MSKGLVSRVSWVVGGAAVGLLVGLPVAIACSFAENRAWELPSVLVGDADGYVPPLQEYTITFQGPDVCETSSCFDLAQLSVAFDLGDAEWPLEGSYDDAEADGLNLLPGYQLELRGDVPCSDNVMPLLADPVFASGSLSRNQYHGSVIWGCNPAPASGWSFDARLAIVDMHGEQGEWTEWRRFEFTDLQRGENCDGLEGLPGEIGRPLDEDGNPIGPSTMPQPAEPSVPDAGDAGDVGAADTGVSGAEAGIVIDDRVETPVEDEEGCSATGSAPTHALLWVVAVVALAWRRRRRV